MSEFLFKQETYEIIGLCMEVHRILGNGFSEIVYKDAMVIEAKLREFAIEREKKYEIVYKEKILPHHFFADFVFFDEIIVEIKAIDKEINDEHIAQTLNYLKISDCRVGLIINFGRKSLEYKRLIF
ncbi:GxxExxY protein [Ferruginibacter sp. SUN106]|uniref:GxxExxY protein n=1 Tax=Ferruginibacter sp. SUN106 TaxID=2978348 RepID=UPI003D3700CE